MKICMILCAAAMLHTVAFASEQRKVPKTEQCTIAADFNSVDVVFVNSYPADMDFAVIIVNDHFDFLATGGLNAAILKGFKAMDAEIFSYESIEGNRPSGWIDPGSNYESPVVDLSYIWKYQHFHSC